MGRFVTKKFSQKKQIKLSECHLLYLLPKIRGYIHALHIYMLLYSSGKRLSVACAYFCMSGYHVRETNVSETFLQNVNNVMTSQGHVSNVTEGAMLALPFKVIEF